MVVVEKEIQMNKEAWFQNFEMIQAEHPEMTDEEAGEAAREKLKDDWADRADQINDERWDRKYDLPNS